MLKTIIKDFADINFEAGDRFMWAPKNNLVVFEPARISSPDGIWTLLHELGHARLGHQQYDNDLHLLIMEVEAWREAKQIAKKYGIEISEDHIDACLESYRDWLHRRSKCIDCQTHALQQDQTTYSCHNCRSVWNVPASKHCQIRRRRVLLNSSK